MKKIVLSTLVCLTFLFSCTIESDEVMEPVESAVEVTMLEDLQFGYPRFLLSFNSVKVYPCANYFILMESSLENNTLNLTLNEIYRDSSCQGSAASAQNAFVFGELVDGEYAFENGTYNINLKVKGKQPATGTLVVTDTDYTLTMAAHPDFTFENNHVYRMPEGVVWGAVRKFTEDAQTNTLFDDFFDLLDEKKLTDSTFASGDYTYFLVDEDGDITLRSESAIPAGTTAFVKYFDQDSVSRTELKTAVGDFKAVYSQKLRVDMFDWEGTVY